MVLYEGISTLVMHIIC